MAPQDARVLIVAPAGPLTDGVHALLATLPAIAGITHADDGAAAVRALMAHHAAVVVLDGGLPDEQVQAVLGHVMAATPRPRCLVLAESVQQQESGALAGADAVLLKGTSAQDLYAITERLLLGP
jgi:DNA-binding NarL/FixJ family response regulator